jgi:hypothetical protein
MVSLVFKDLLELTEEVVKTVFLAFLVSMESPSRARLVWRENAANPARLALLLKLASLSLFLDQREKKVLLESLVNRLSDLLVETENKANKVQLVRWECLADLDDLLKMANLELLDLSDLLDRQHQLSLANQLLGLKEPLEKTVSLADMAWTAKTVSKVLRENAVHEVMKVLLDSTVCLDLQAHAQQRNALAVS